MFREGKEKELSTLYRSVFSGLLADGSGGQKGPLPKICQAYVTLMKLGTVIPHDEKIQKIDKSCDTLEFL